MTHALNGITPVKHLQLNIFLYSDKLYAMRGLETRHPVGGCALFIFSSAMLADARNRPRSETPPTIYFRGGTYFLSKPLIFNGEDSQLSLSAYPGGLRS